MDRLLAICIFFYLCTVQLYGQSSTTEQTPRFYAQLEHYQTEEITLVYDHNETPFIGLSFYHTEGNAVELSYRLKEHSGWTPWKDFEEQHEYVAFPRRAYVAKPIRQSFQKIQIRSSKEFSADYRFRAFYGKPQQVKHMESSTRILDCALPDFCDRNCWCPTCPIDATPQFTEPTHIIVHHSAGFNESNDFASVVEFYWDLHVNTNGWDDIGYNWLIDANGIIYQGRPDNYQGAHFSCINENTVGICLIGDFTTLLPSEEAIASLTGLIGFEASDHQIDVLDASYHETGDFITENVSGHRDAGDSQNACSSTVCPGDSFYPNLGEIRTAVSNLECYQDAISSSDILRQTHLTIYPNPLLDELYIKTDERVNTQLELVHSSGIHIMYLDINRKINTGHLEAGMYFVLLNGKILKKLIKL